jgi:twitching motility two-component system response regulator PilH
MPVKKIMVVDDSPTERFFLQELLVKNGYNVVTADTGEAAVQMAPKEMPDLVIMDVVMPGLNGFQATRQITKAPETAHIPVFMCTTKDQETDKIWGVRQGAKDYLVKPVNAAELLAKN